jgi:putative transposase
LQDVILRVERTFPAVFHTLKDGEKPDYPRFKGWSRHNSFTYPQYGGGAVLDGGLLSLSKIGRIRLHRPPQGTPKTVTISQEADGWYACLSCAEVPTDTEPLPSTGHETGIDVGLKVFLVTADATGVETPRHYQEAEQQLFKAQRQVSRRKKGSNHRTKAMALLKRKHQQEQSQRRDSHHQTALALVRQFDTIYLEELQVHILVGNRYIAKSINDASWRQFRAILTFKAAWAGKRVVAVPAQYTGPDCSGCGKRVRKSLSVRTHVYPSCGLVLDRDVNAALNMLHRGQRRSGAGQTVQA